MSYVQFAVICASMAIVYLLAIVYLWSFSINPMVTKYMENERNNDDFQMKCKIYVYNISESKKYHLALNINSFGINDWNQQDLRYLFNNAIETHPLRTYDINDADLFYIPPPTTCAHCDNNDCYNETCYDNMYTFITQQKLHNGDDHIKIRNNISNHFLLLWRPNGIYTCCRKWFKHQQFIFSANVTKLTVENELDTYNKGWLEIPYISNFLEQPKHTIEQFHNYRNETNKYFISGIFNPRWWDKGVRNGVIRHTLTEQCFNYSDNICYIEGLGKKLKGKGKRNLTFASKFMNIYRQSTFTLQPEGDTWSRKAVYDSLLMGAIPVIFDIRTFVDDPLFGIDYSKYPIYVLIDIERVISGEINVIETLLSIKEEQIQILRNNIKKYVNRLRYYDYRYRYAVKHTDDVIDYILNYLCQNTKDTLANTTVKEYNDKRKTMRNPKLNHKSNIHSLMHI
eukprot:362729_1